MLTAIPLFRFGVWGRLVTVAIINSPPQTIIPVGGLLQLLSQFTSCRGECRSDGTSPSAIAAASGASWWDESWIKCCLPKTGSQKPGSKPGCSKLISAAQSSLSSGPRKQQDKCLLCHSISVAAVGSASIWEYFNFELPRCYASSSDILQYWTMAELVQNLERKITSLSPIFGPFKQNSSK